MIGKGNRSWENRRVIAKLFAAVKQTILGLVLYFLFMLPLIVGFILWDKTWDDKCAAGEAKAAHCPAVNKE